MRCTDKIPVDKMPVRIAGEDKMLAILWDREGKMLIVSKHFIYHTDGQVNRKSFYQKKIFCKNLQYKIPQYKIPLTKCCITHLNPGQNAGQIEWVDKMLAGLGTGWTKCRSKKIFLISSISQ